MSRGKLQLAGVTSMWVAAKYEEIYAPNAGQFCYITDNTYSKEQLVTMEEQLLAALDFRLTAPTVKTFLRRWLQACVADEQLHYLASYIAELSLLDHRMLQYMPAVVAAAAVYLARTMLRSKSWNTTLQHYTQLTPVELQVRGRGGAADALQQLPPHCLQSQHPCCMYTLDTSAGTCRGHWYVSSCCMLHAVWHRMCIQCIVQSSLKHQVLRLLLLMSPLQPCAAMLLELHKQSYSRDDLVAVKEKYSTPKYHHVSKLPPLQFLPAVPTVHAQF